MSHIKFPIGKHKITGELIKITDAKNGKKCNCVCFSCGDDLVAFNNGVKQKEHFRHKVNSNCNASYESYIHWLAKEIFKTLKYLTLPPIYAFNLDFDENMRFSKAVNKELRNYNSKSSRLINASKEMLLQESQKIKISNFSIEKSFKSKNGIIRADIVISSDEVDLIIEPFFTNEIDEFKLEKLNFIDKTTISIDLNSFIYEKGHFFNYEDFKRHIQDNIECKEWIYIREQKRNSLEKKYLEKFRVNLLKESKYKDNYFESLGEINDLEKRIITLTNRRNRLITGVNRFTKQISEIQDLISKSQKFQDNAFENLINKIE